MQNVTRNIKLNMQKTMIIICQQCVKTNTFSVSFHILFSPFFAIFAQDTSKSGFGDGQKWAKMGLDPPKRERNGVFKLINEEVITQNIST